MQIHEVIEKKKNLQDQLNKLVVEFEQETGVYVSNLSLDRISFTTVRGVHVPAAVAITIEARI